MCVYVCILYIYIFLGKKIKKVVRKRWEIAEMGGLSDKGRKMVEDEGIGWEAAKINEHLNIVLQTNILNLHKLCIYMKVNQTKSPSIREGIVPPCHLLSSNKASNTGIGWYWIDVFVNVIPWESLNNPGYCQYCKLLSKNSGQKYIIEENISTSLKMMNLSWCLSTAFIPIF